MLRTYLNDLRDDNAAVVVLDPKSELSRLCLAAHPARLRQARLVPRPRPPAVRDEPAAAHRPTTRCRCRPPRSPTTSSPRCWTSTRTRSSSPRAATSTTPSSARSRSPPSRTAAPRFEDVYSLLLPKKDDFRQAVYQACADTPDLDQTAEFFRTELPQDLELAGSATAQRLDAPRNKVSLLTGVPPLRRFFNHTSDIALGDIIDARDVLIVDANMAAIGAENSKACMHFVLRMLHTQLQRQVRRPETDRPRVALLADEAHYLASAENVVDQIATHRAAGLDVTFGLQYLAQLGSGSEHQQKIRKGIVNLLQSRFLFRLGDHEDAEEATRIAMAVYSTMIRDDPDSRARMRVTPEQTLNLPVHFCLASWIAGGSRAASFIGQTFPFPTPISDTWARIHLERLREKVGPYPEVMASTLERVAPRPTRQQPTSAAPHDGNDRSHDRATGQLGRRSRHETSAARTRLLVDAGTDSAETASDRPGDLRRRRESSAKPIDPGSAAPRADRRAARAGAAASAGQQPRPPSRRSTRPGRA